MAWKPKTIAGKILKGAVIAGGSVLALGATVVIGAKAGGAIKRAVNAVKDKAVAEGTTVLSNVGKSVTSGIKATVNQVNESAINLVAGTTNVEREFQRGMKEKVRTSLSNLGEMARLMRQGRTAEQARAEVGMTSNELADFEGKPVKTSSMFDFLQNKNVIYILGAVAAVFLLTKKKR